MDGLQKNENRTPISEGGVSTKFAQQFDRTTVTAPPLVDCVYWRYHKIGYHIYADGTQLYISLKCKQPLEATSKLNSCLSDIKKINNNNIGGG